jgi:high-affinity iron transporter
VTRHATARGFALAVAALLGACGNEPPAADAVNSAPIAYACIAGDAPRGAALYAQHCATCHGATGGADGPITSDLSTKPARHDDGAVMNALSNEQLVRVIAEGGAALGKSPQMTPFGGVLTPGEVLDVVAFVRSLARPPYACP